MTGLFRFERLERGRDLMRVEQGALGEVTTLVLAAGSEQVAHAFDAEAVELVDGAQHRQLLALVGNADRLHDAVEHFPRIDLDDVLPARDAEFLDRVGGHHAHLGVGGDRGGADRIGIELHKLAEASRPRLLVAEHPAGAVAAIRLGQALVVLGDVAGERRRQVVAQAEPLLVVVEERKDTFVRPVLVGQELAERVGIFDERGLDRLETIALVDAADARHHALGGADVGRRTVDKAARQARFWFLVAGRHGARFLSHRSESGKVAKALRPLSAG